MNKGRIIVSVTNDLLTDQRVHRSCLAMTEEGYDVTLIGRMLKDSKPLQRPYHVIRMRLLFNRKALFYAEYNIRLFLKLLFSKADCFYANDTDTLPANYFAARLRAKKLVFDAHELFPEVPELTSRPAVKKVWTWIEDTLFPRLARHSNPNIPATTAAFTVCKSIADIYKQRYGLQMTVVRNVPLRRPAVVHADSNPHKILLYQGAVNVGRGIEWMMQAMKYLPDCLFVVAGTGDLFYELKQNTLDNVLFVGRLQPDELYKLTAKASLGISLLENRGLNYYYSLPNRLADFVQAGVPVLATDFPEIRAVVERYGVGTLLPPQPFFRDKGVSQPPDPMLLAQKVRETLAFWEKMSPDEKQRRFNLAASDLSWDNDKKVLINSINTIMGHDK